MSVTQSRLPSHPHVPLPMGEGGRRPGEGAIELPTLCIAAESRTEGHRLTGLAEQGPTHGEAGLFCVWTKVKMSACYQDRSVLFRPLESETRNSLNPE